MEYISVLVVNDGDRSAVISDGTLHFSAMKSYNLKLINSESSLIPPKSNLLLKYTISEKLEKNPKSDEYCTIDIHASDFDEQDRKYLPGRNHRKDREYTGTRSYIVWDRLPCGEIRAVQSEYTPTELDVNVANVADEVKDKGK